MRLQCLEFILFKTYYLKPLHERDIPTAGETSKLRMRRSNHPNAKSTPGHNTRAASLILRVEWLAELWNFFSHSIWQKAGVPFPSPFVFLFFFGARNKGMGGLGPPHSPLFSPNKSLDRLPCPCRDPVASAFIFIILC